MPFLSKIGLFKVINLLQAMDEWLWSAIATHPGQPLDIAAG